MNERFWINVAKENWYLLAAIVVCVGAFAYKVTSSGADAPEPLVERPYAATTGSSQSDSLDMLQKTRPSVREKTMAVIESHRTKIEQNPKGEEAPALLGAMGNLYVQKLGDYDEAIRCYEGILVSYPDSPSARAAYIHLADCYERKGDRENAKRIYARMMERFPEDTQEHQYAYAMMYKGTDSVG